MDKHATPGPLWDRQGALIRLGHSQALLDKVVIMFLAQVNEKVVQLRDAIDQRDSKAVRHLSHYLKGGAGDIGVTRLYDYCAFIEDKAKDNDMAAIDATLSDFEQTVSDTLHCLQSQQQQQQ